jgi:hypothetical protein
MTRRLGLALLGGIMGTASLPGCIHPRQDPGFVDQSWWARQQVEGFSTSNSEPDAQASKPQSKKVSLQQESKPQYVTVVAEETKPRIVPPKTQPPELPEIKPPPTLVDKPPFVPTANDKGPDLPPFKTIESVVQERPQEPLTLALQCILENRHNEALEHLKKYDPATQELFIRLLPPLALTCKKSLARLSAAEVAALHDQLQGLQATLRPRTELVIDKMCFCESVRAYGVYKPLPAHSSFIAGTPTRPGDFVQLYVELRNFASEPRGGVFETRLASTVEILDPQGRQVWFKNFEDGKKPYRSQTLLHDYYNTYSFHVPHLPPGTYSLKLQIVDETRPDARRSAHKTLDFRVSALSRQ